MGFFYFSKNHSIKYSVFDVCRYCAECDIIKNISDRLVNFFNPSYLIGKLIHPSTLSIQPSINISTPDPFIHPAIHNHSLIHSSIYPSIHFFCLHPSEFIHPYMHLYMDTYIHTYMLSTRFKLWLWGIAYSATRALVRLGTDVRQEGMGIFSLPVHPVPFSGLNVRGLCRSVDFFLGNFAY